MKERGYILWQGRREASLTKLLLVKITHEPLGIGNVIPPQLILSISHRERGKHERRRIHQNLRRVCTHQLTRSSYKQRPAPSKGWVATKEIMTVASRLGLTSGGTPTQDPHVICKKNSWLKRKPLKHAMTANSEEFYSHLQKRGC